MSLNSLAAVILIFNCFSFATSEAESLSAIVTSDESELRVEDLLQYIPFKTNLTNNEVLELFQKSVNSVHEEENLVFSEIVESANNFRIKSTGDLSRESLPEKYQNLKLIVDKHGEIRVPNLFKVGDRPEVPSTLQRYEKFLARQVEELKHKLSDTDNEISKFRDEKEISNSKYHGKEVDKDYKKSEMYLKHDKNNFNMEKQKKMSERLEVYEIFTTKKTTTTTTSTTSSTTSTSSTTTTTSSTTTKVSIATTATPRYSTRSTTTTTSTIKTTTVRTPSTFQSTTKRSTQSFSSLAQEFIESLKSSKETEKLLKNSKFDVEDFLKDVNKKKKLNERRPIGPQLIELNRKNDRKSQANKFPHFKPKPVNHHKRRKHFKSKHFRIKKVTNPPASVTPVPKLGNTIEKENISLIDLENELGDSEDDDTFKRELMSQNNTALLKELKNNLVLHSQNKKKEEKIVTKTSSSSSPKRNGSLKTPVPVFKVPIESLPAVPSLHSNPIPRLIPALSPNSKLNEDLGKPSISTVKAFPPPPPPVPMKGVFVPVPESDPDISEQVPFEELKHKMDNIQSNPNLAPPTPSDHSEKNFPKQLSSLRVNSKENDSSVPASSTSMANNHNAADPAPMMLDLKNAPVPSAVNSNVNAAFDPVQVISNSQDASSSIPVNFNFNDPIAPAPVISSEKDIFAPVPNWDNQFQPYLVTTTRPDTSTTKAYEFATQNSFVSINLGRPKNVYPFAETLQVSQKIPEIADNDKSSDELHDNIIAASDSVNTLPAVSKPEINEPDHMKTMENVPKEPAKPKKLPPKIPPYLSSIYHVVTPSPVPAPRPTPNSSPNSIFPIYPTSTFPPFHVNIAPFQNKTSPSIFHLKYPLAPPVEVSTLPPLQYSTPSPFPYHSTPTPVHYSTTKSPIIHQSTTTLSPFHYTSTVPSPIHQSTTIHPPPFAYSSTTLPPLLPHYTPSPPPFHFTSTQTSRAQPLYSQVTPRPIFFDAPLQHKNSPIPSSVEPYKYRYSTTAPSSSLPSLSPSLPSMASLYNQNVPVYPQHSHHAAHQNNSFVVSVIKDETINLEDHSNPKRNSIGNVLKNFQEKTFKSLYRTEDNLYKSYSYQSHTTPAMNIKIVSEHTTTTPSPIIRHSPTPKLQNPYEHGPTPKLQNPYEGIEKSQPSWQDSEIILSFKSEPNNHQPVDTNDYSHPSFSPQIIDSPVYSEESLSQSFISRPVRFHQGETPKKKRQIRWPE